MTSHLLANILSKTVTSICRYLAVVLRIAKIRSLFLIRSGRHFDLPLSDNMMKFISTVMNHTNVDVTVLTEIILGINSNILISLVIDR